MSDPNKNRHESPATNRRVVVDLEHVTVEQTQIPTPSDKEALVETIVAGVCGSDTHAVHGRHPFISLPYYPGHEVVGVVRDLGSAVTDIQIGQRVTLEPTLPCWDCKQCRAGRENSCERLQWFGCGGPQGGMANFFTIPANRLHAVPDDLSDEEASLIEPSATAVHAINLAAGVQGKTVVILGVGTIGLLLLCVAKSYGARRIVVSDPLATKRKRALRLDAHTAVDATTPGVVDVIRQDLGESADVVFDCVANQQTVVQAISLAQKAGTVVVVGVPVEDVTIPLPSMQDQQINLQGSASYQSAEFEEAIKIITSGAINVDEFLTATVDLEQAANAFELSTSGEHVKVLIKGAFTGL